MVFRKILLEHAALESSFQSGREFGNIFARLFVQMLKPLVFGAAFGEFLLNAHSLCHARADIVNALAFAVGLNGLVVKNDIGDVAVAVGGPVRLFQIGAAGQQVIRVAG